MVISQSGAKRRRARMSPISVAMVDGSNRLGVPPPMNTLCTTRPQISGSAASRSAISACVYAACGKLPAVCACELKSQ